MPDDAYVGWVVRRAWCTALGIEFSSISTDDLEIGFFELGGGSLAAATLAETVSSSLEIDFPLELLFQGDGLQALVVECQKLHQLGRGAER
jgi:Phosphopantetheine attachment site